MCPEYIHVCAFIYYFLYLLHVCLLKNMCFCVAHVIHPYTNTTPVLCSCLCIRCFTLTPALYLCGCFIHRCFKPALNLCCFVFLGCFHSHTFSLSVLLYFFHRCFTLTPALYLCYYVSSTACCGQCVITGTSSRLKTPTDSSSVMVSVYMDSPDWWMLFICTVYYQNWQICNHFADWVFGHSTNSEAVLFY